METASRKPKRATYQSPLREEQTQKTGERILEKLAEHLAEQGWETFSIAQVAELAGVSEPTVYRHFANREAMLDALAVWMHERVVLAYAPGEVEDLPTFAHALFDHFQENAGLVRAMLRAAVGREVREHGRKKRDRDTQKLLSAGFEHLSPEEARAAGAVLRIMISGESWEAMTGRLGVTPQAASAAVAWASRALIDAARKDQKQGRRTLVPPEMVGEAKAVHERWHARAAEKTST